MKNVKHISLAYIFGKIYAKITYVKVCTCFRNKIRSIRTGQTMHTCTSLWEMRKQVEICHHLALSDTVCRTNWNSSLHWFCSVCKEIKITNWESTLSTMLHNLMNQMTKTLTRHLRIITQMHLLLQTWKCLDGFLRHPTAKWTYYVNLKQERK